MPNVSNNLEIVTVSDCRQAGHCARGIKNWFEAYGFDFREFLKHGIPADKFLATGDAYAIDIVKKKRERGN